MSDELAWDAEDFEPPKIVAPKTTDKWEGEDEDADAKDNWDDDSDEEKSEKSESDKAPKRKKRNLATIVAEKEKRQLEELERRKQLAEEAKLAETPEEVLAEKLRVLKIQEESDRLLAADLMGGGDDEDKLEDDESKALDAFDLDDGSSLESFRRSLITKIRSVDRLEKKPYFVTFVEDLSRDLCFNLESDDIKRVTTVLNGIYNEKVKASKPTKGKKKAANKAKLNAGNNAITDSMANDFGYSEFDDFI